MRSRTVGLGRIHASASRPRTPTKTAAIAKPAAPGASTAD